MSPAGTSFLDRFFKIKESGSSVRTEVLAGLTTFLAMSYILVVNPSILKDAGMDFGAVFVATCISSAFACMMMGLVANYPIALAPGMGLNAYFTYAVVKGMGISWQVALGAVFVSGIVFIILSLFKVREAIVNSLPNSLKYSIGGGIGLFLALVALKSAEVVVSNPNTLVSLGDIHCGLLFHSYFGAFPHTWRNYYRYFGNYGYCFSSRS